MLHILKMWGVRTETGYAIDWGRGFVFVSTEEESYGYHQD